MNNNFNDDEMFLEDEILDDEFYDDDEYIEIPTLKGVVVKDTEKGIKITLMGMYDILNTYEIEMNIKGYSETDLFNTCYNVSKIINSLYYERNGVLDITEVKDIIRKELVK